LHALLLPMLLAPLAHSFGGCAPQAAQAFVDAGATTETPQDPAGDAAGVRHCPLCCTLQHAAALPPPPASTLTLDLPRSAAIYAPVAAPTPRWLNRAARARGPPHAA
jgi:hypothetical protein